MMWTALLMGMGGSLHCAGMCSPLALSVTTFNKRVLLNRLLYNSGRIFVYGLMGAVVASVGSLFDFAAFQNILSISLGTLLILIGVGTLSTVRIPVLTTLVNRLVLFIKKRFSFLMQRKNYGALWFMGMLNGILPCGLTYLTVSYTLTLNSAFEGFLFMILFGLGTFPVMIGLPYVVQFIGKYVRVSFSRLTTILMISVGVLLIGRTLLTHQHPVDAQNLLISEPVICK